MPDIGDFYVIRTSTFDEDEVLFDPTTIDIEVTSPSGVVTTPTVTNTNAEVGKYHTTVLLDAGGRWSWKWTTTGPDGVDHQHILVDADPPSRPSADRLTVQRWVGTMTDAQWAEYSEYTATLGDPLLTALQIMMGRRADFVTSPASVASGSDRVSHAANLKAIEKVIDELASTINKQLGSLTMTVAGEELLAQALSGKTDETIIVRTAARNPRRG